MTATIALVDDDRNILTSVSIALQAEGFLTRVYPDSEAALKALSDNPPDLAVFDIKMPRMDGLELLRRFRERHATPVIFLTSRDDEMDEALGLAMGADDYIAKPFSQRLLIARIRAILRRTEPPPPNAGAEATPMLVRGRLTMDPPRHRTTWAGAAVTLTVTEFLILEALAQRPGVVKTRNQLMDAAYQDDIYVDDRTIDSHIKRVRRKFRQVDPAFDSIETLYGAGYRFFRGMTAPPGDDPRDLTLRWSGQISLTQRILLVNLLALLLLAGGFFYLDSYRSRIVDGRVAQASREARLIAEALAVAPPAGRDVLLLRLARDTGNRIRLLPRDGAVVDTRSLGLRNFAIADPDRQGLDQRIARFLDGTIDTVVAAPRPPLFRDRSDPRTLPDVRAVRATGGIATTVWRAPDRTSVITAAAPLPDGSIVLTTANARDITATVRIERFRLSVVLLLVTGFSVLLSLFLARTIVRPLRRLARAAVRVRLGRAREVVVPRLPSRRDELGMLARALSDMSLALRARIDSTEAFAADVTHELKNPLASLRSALDGLARVEQPALRDQLLGIARDDVLRLDRLITDISYASRVDAQLSRATFEPVDVAAMLAGLLVQRTTRGVERGICLGFDPREPSLVVQGEGARLERVFENLLDNAVSFSPDGGLITVSGRAEPGWVVVHVEDDGPGVPADAREAIFHRFQSIRPEGEAFGRHSGLGLAIARTIVEGHGGRIAADARADGRPGALFVVCLPATESLEETS